MRLEKKAVRSLKSLSDFAEFMIQAIEDQQKIPEGLKLEYHRREKGVFSYLLHRLGISLMTRKQYRALARKIAGETAENMRVNFAKERTAWQANKADNKKPELQPSIDFASQMDMWNDDAMLSYLKSDKNHLYKLAEAEVRESLNGKKIDDKRIKEVVENHMRVVAGILGFSAPAMIGGFDFTDRMVMAFQRQSSIRYHADPHAKSIIDNLVSYTIGRGVQFSAPNSDVQEFLETVYWHDNDMESWHKERVLLFFINGEHFPLYEEIKLDEIPAGDPWKGWRMNVFSTPPHEIVDIDVQQERFRLKYVREDKDSSADIYYGDIDLDKWQARGIQSDFQNEIEVDKAMMQWRLGIGKRGKPILLPVLRYLKYYEDFVKDCQRHWHEQARVIMIKYSEDRENDSLGDIYPAPAGGLMLVGAKDQLEYEFTSPKLNSTGADVLGRILRLSISAGTRTPEVIAFMDASETVYASIRTTENPYSAQITDLQDTVKDYMAREIKYILRRAVANKVLPDKVEIIQVDEESEFFEDEKKKTAEKVEVKTEDIPIEFIFPPVVKEDIKALSEAYKIHDEQGWAHRSQISRKLDWDFKKTLLLEEKERMRRDEQDEIIRQRISQGQDAGNTGEEE